MLANSEINNIYKKAYIFNSRGESILTGGGNAFAAAASGALTKHTLNIDNGVKSNNTNKSDKIEFYYSPSRPILFAFEECKVKGSMVVSSVFSYDVMRKLTHGMIEKKTSKGIYECIK